MINIFVLFFLFILLVTQKVLLLNEESLILLCFITFIILSLKNLKVFINELFRSQSIEIEKNLKNSLRSVLDLLNKFSILKESYKNVLQKFFILKNYYCDLILLLGNFLINYNKYYWIIAFKKRLIFLNKVENQTVKLLLIVIVKKLNKIIKIKHFYKTSVKLKYFLCLNVISLRECIQLINLNNKK